MEEITLPPCRVWQTERVLDFKKISDVIAWAGEQKDFWCPPAGMQINQYDQFGGQLANQIAQISAIESQGNGYRSAADQSSSQDSLARLRTLFTNIENGTLLTSDSVGANVIVKAMREVPGIAAIVYCSYRRDAIDLLNRTSLQTADVVQLAKFNNPATFSDTTKSERDELARLKNAYEADLSALREHTAAQVQSSESAEQAEMAASDARADIWKKKLSDYQGEWDTLKKTYDEKLGLLAPTTYWGDRGKNSRSITIIFSVAFLICAGIFLALFFEYGVPHLQGIKQESPFVSAIPVVVPVLVGVWVLRVLARLFSENLKIQQDARERETLVKTFLALMRDEKNGKALVTDDDRKIILQALFRQSAVTASDDSPPFSIFDFIRGTGKP